MDSVNNSDKQLKNKKTKNQLSSNHEQNTGLHQNNQLPIKPLRKIYNLGSKSSRLLLRFKQATTTIKTFPKSVYKVKKAKNKYTDDIMLENIDTLFCMRN